MSEEPRPEWLPPKAPGAQAPREWHSVPEPDPLPAAEPRPEHAAGGEAARPSPLGSVAGGGAAEPGAAPPTPGRGPAVTDRRDWWRAGGAPARPAGGPVPMAARGAARPAGNGQALASLVLGIAGLVLFFAAGFGLVFVLNLPCSIMAWAFGVQGRRKVDRGETAERRGMAQAGMVLGIVGTVIGGLAIIAWALGFLLSDELRDQFQREWERRQNA